MVHVLVGRKMRLNKELNILVLNALETLPSNAVNTANAPRYRQPLSKREEGRRQRACQPKDA